MAEQKHERTPIKRFREHIDSTNSFRAEDGRPPLTKQQEEAVRELFWKKYGDLMNESGEA